MTILEENFKWHLEAFASELFTYLYLYEDIKCKDLYVVYTYIDIHMKTSNAKTSKSIRHFSFKFPIKFLILLILVTFLIRHLSIGLKTFSLQLK